VISWRSRRMWMAIAGFLIVILLLWRPGADRLRSRLEQSLGSALGHKVEIGEVSLRMLPQPGFSLSQFTVRDDLEFSAEPILRADEVTATIHPSSLWRWRIEIASLNFKEASLNLVRRPDGRWNIETILERAALTPTAPTGGARADSRPRFPYLEVSDGRVNFKLGAEKTPYALTNADLALWLESDSEWGMRFRGQPVRTDMRLSDTGIVSADGTWRRGDVLRTHVPTGNTRARNLGQSPVRLTARFEGAQLGQLTKLISGADKGWRGTVVLSANLTGSPNNLRVQSEVSVENFRRYDIVAGQSLQLAAHCNARYSSSPHQLSEILCNSPGGDGVLQLRGRILLAGPRAYELNLEATKFPAERVADLVRRVKKGLPADLSASGTINADLTFRDDGNGTSDWSGKGDTSGLLIRSTALQVKNDGDTLALGSVPFRAVSVARTKRGKTPSDLLPPGNALEVGPFPMELAQGRHASLHAWFAREGYGVNFSGDGSLQRLLQLARTAGVTAIHPAVEGDAAFDWSARGSWGGFAPPQTTGTISLRHARAEFAGLNAPVEISATEIVLTPDTLRLEKLSATAGGIHWTGSALRPRICPGPRVCPTTIDLHADEISPGKLNLLLNPNVNKQPWYRILSGGQPTVSVLRNLRVVGTLKVDRFVAGDLTAEAITAGLKLEDSHLGLSILRGTVLGGLHSGEWQADFTTAAPNYKVIGTFSSISLLQLDKLMHNNWITGTASGEYALDMNGWDAKELQNSSHGTLTFEALNGAFLRFGSAASPLKFNRVQGTLAAGKSLLVISQGKLENAPGIYDISGVASFGYNLDLKFLRKGDHGFTVRGTLDEPHVEPITAEPASLKK
jgi:hypothetical protein